MLIGPKSLLGVLIATALLGERLAGWLDGVMVEAGLREGIR